MLLLVFYMLAKLFHWVFPSHQHFVSVDWFGLFPPVFDPPEFAQSTWQDRVLKRFFHIRDFACALLRDTSSPTCELTELITHTSLLPPLV